MPARSHVPLLGENIDRSTDEIDTQCLDSAPLVFSGAQPNAHRISRSPSLGATAPTPNWFSSNSENITCPTTPSISEFNGLSNPFGFTGCAPTPLSLEMQTHDSAGRNLTPPPLSLHGRTSTEPLDRSGSLLSCRTSQRYHHDPYSFEESLRLSPQSVRGESPPPAAVLECAAAVPGAGGVDARAPGPQPASVPRRPSPAVPAVGSMGSMGAVPAVGSMGSVGAVPAVGSMGSVGAVPAVGSMVSLGAVTAVGPMGTVTAVRPMGPLGTVTAVGPMGPLGTVTAVGPMGALGAVTGVGPMGAGAKSAAAEGAARRRGVPTGDGRNRRKGRNGEGGRIGRTLPDVPPPASMRYPLPPPPPPHADKDGEVFVVSESFLCASKRWYERVQAMDNGCAVSAGGQMWLLGNPTDPSATLANIPRSCPTPECHPPPMQWYVDCLEWWYDYIEPITGAPPRRRAPAAAAPAPPPYPAV